MNAGSLNQQITLQARGTGSDSWGQPMETWTDVATCWANVRFLNGREYLTAGKQVQEASASIRIRPRTISPSMRVLHRGTVYAIVAVLPGPRCEYIDLVVSSGASEG